MILDYMYRLYQLYAPCPRQKDMAFKRSAVRSRLSPPENFRNLRVSEVFLCFCAVFVLYIGGYLSTRNIPPNHTPTGFRPIFEHKTPSGSRFPGSFSHGCRFYFACRFRLSEISHASFSFWVANTSLNRWTAAWRMGSWTWR